MRRPAARETAAAAAAACLVTAGLFMVGDRAELRRTGMAPSVVPTRSIRLADGLSCEVYVPTGLDRTKPHPLVFGFDPGGNGLALLPAWKRACDRFQWILVASNNFRNGPWSDRDAALQLETLRLAEHDYPVDPARIYATGFSGGAMHAHDIVGDHPEIFRGLVANTGMMPYHWPGNDPLDRAHYPKAKLAVFLASPADFRYREMRADRAALEGLGWKVRWIEFPGGHRYAPPESYVEAAAWLAAQ
jgi:poly(3-hydroxybutyrate) depolymerase